MRAALRPVRRRRAARWCGWRAAGSRGASVAWTAVVLAGHVAVRHPLRHRGADVLARHPARARSATSRSCRRSIADAVRAWRGWPCVTGPACCSPTTGRFYLVHRHGGPCSSSLARPRRGREPARGGRAAPCSHGRGLAAVPPVGADLPQPVAPHGHALGRARQLPGDGQRGQRVRGWRHRRGPGPGAHHLRPRRPGGVRPGHRRPAHRARPPHPAARARARRGHRRHPAHRRRPWGSRPAVRYAARYTAVVFGLFILLIALGHDRVRRPRGSGCGIIAVAVRAGLWGADWRTSPSSAPRRATGRGDRRHRPAGRHRRLLPRPARARREPPPAATATCSSPTRGRRPPEHRRLGRLRRTARAPPTRVAFADLLHARAGPGHDVFLVWSGAYRTHDDVCEQIVGRLVGAPARRPARSRHAQKVLRVRGAAPLPASVSLTRAAETARRGARAAVLPGWVVARLLVLGALALSRFLVDELRPAVAGAAARAHEGLLGWDASWYARHRRARVRRPRPTRASDSSRSCPSSPAGSPPITPFDERAALVVVANAVCTRPRRAALPARPPRDGRRPHSPAGRCGSWRSRPPRTSS